MFKDAAISLLTTRSGRMKLLNNLEIELFCELVAQYLVTGKVKLVSDNPRIKKYQNNINELMKQMFDNLVGGVISF
jgi:nanoRNase/pAp phosphatase (c-di-AMP/oligoRNAs hydrolase)